MFTKDNTEFQFKALIGLWIHGFSTRNFFCNFYAKSLFLKDNEKKLFSRLSCGHRVELYVLYCTVLYTEQYVLTVQNCTVQYVVSS